MVKEASHERVKINFRLDAETMRKAKSLAELMGIPLNGLFSMAVQTYLDNIPSRRCSTERKAGGAK